MMCTPASRRNFLAPICGKVWSTVDAAIRVFVKLMLILFFRGCIRESSGLSYGVLFSHRVGAIHHRRSPHAPCAFFFSSKLECRALILHVIDAQSSSRSPTSPASR